MAFRYVFSIFLIFATDFIYSQSEIMYGNGNLNFTSIVTKYGMQIEDYDVQTEDGYILKLYRIPGNATRPVLLVHGILDSAYSFIIRGKHSLAYNMAQTGYDVWLVNLRGVLDSRRHVKLRVKDPKFWDYSFHESGYYDLPATIDFILDKTKQNKLSAIGHSQGNTIFYALASTKPEYNDKINVMIALAPVCYLSNLKSPVSDLVESGASINEILIASEQEEILSEGTFYRTMLDTVCKMPTIGYSTCGKMLMAFAGDDQDEFPFNIYYAVLGHYPTSTSRKSVLHLMQIAVSNEFAWFDNGANKNKEIYGTESPPKYDLNKVTMNVALFAGKNDRLSPMKDVRRLRKSLPNVVEFTVMEREKFNHIDFIWGKNMVKYIVPLVLNTLDRFST